MTLLLERLVPDLEGPDRGADGLTDALAAPGVRTARVVAVPVEERALQRRVAAELLDGQP